MSVLARAFLLAPALLLGACREGTSSIGSFVPLAPSVAGTQGCAPAPPVPGTLTPVFSAAYLGHDSQLAATAGAENLYVTGSDGSVHLLEFPIGGGPPTDTTWVAPGVIEASYLAPAGIAAPARLSGIALFDDAVLIVVEHTSNSLIQVNRLAPDDVAGFAGLPDTNGGRADGSAGGIRFNFTEPVPLLCASDGQVFVGDTGNHLLRLVVAGVLANSFTVAGSGAPGFDDGALTSTVFDTPSGFATSCAGELLLVESGAAGFGGQRLRALSIGSQNVLGFTGTSLVLAGDGTAASEQGIDTAARLAAPAGLVSSEDGLAFWVDAELGILRRYAFDTGLSDCPLFPDCAAAVTAGGSFTDAGGFALALGDSGALYVLDGDAGTLFRVDP